MYTESLLKAFEGGKTASLDRLPEGSVAQTVANGEVGKFWLQVAVERQRPCRRAVGSREMSVAGRRQPGVAVTEPPGNQGCNVRLLQRRVEKAAIEGRDFTVAHGSRGRGGDVQHIEFRDDNAHAAGSDLVE